MIVRAAAVTRRGEATVGVRRDRDEERGRRRPGGVARPVSKSAVLGLEVTVLALEGEGATEERLHVDRRQPDEAARGDDDGEDEDDAIHSCAS